jgi:NIPSNAP
VSIYELRTYQAHPGKLDALEARFRDHTVELFEKHGITVTGFWTVDGGDGDTLVYLLSFADRAAAEASWKGFLADPEWASVRAESEKDGPLTAKIDSTYLNPTDFSPLR